MKKLSDIADLAGVSPTTVSFVLNDRHQAMHISEKTRLKVLQAAEDLGYRSNQWARAMRTGNSRMLGFLGGQPAEEQVGRMLEGALAAADAQGYTLKLLRLHAFDNNAQQVIRRSSELRLMGMLALHLPEPVLEELCTEAQEHDTPLVLMDTHVQNAGLARVVADEASGIVAGVEHLVKLGHTRIAFLEAGRDSSLGTLRRQAFQDTLQRFGLTAPESFYQEGAFRYREPSLEAARNLLSLPGQQRPTAVLCSGDLMALSVLQVAREQELRVPHDLSVVGFANFTAAEFATPPLTTIEQPFVEIGRTAVEMLLEIIQYKEYQRKSRNSSTYTTATTSTTRAANFIPTASESADKAGNFIKVLPTQLIQRASTAPPPRA